MKENVVIFHNIFTPYRHTLFEALAERKNLSVIYLDKNLGRDNWIKQSLSTTCKYERCYLFELTLRKFINLLRLLKSADHVLFFYNGKQTIPFTFMLLLSRILHSRFYLNIWIEDLVDLNPYRARHFIFRKFLEQMHLKLANRIFAVGKKVNSSLSSVYLRKSVQLFQTSTSIGDIVTDISVNEPIKVVYVGQFIKRKRIGNIIKIANTLVDDKRFEFHLIGGDIDLQSLPNNVHVHPFEPSRRSLLTKIRQFDILLHIPLHEPWGLVINEAQACGLACIVSDNIGAAECVETAGVIIDNNTNLNSSVVEALQIYASNQETLYKDRMRAIDQASLYSYERLTDQIEELLS